MPYARKTRDRYDIETNHGYGWETECSSYEYTDARQTLADYRANACGRFSTRLVKRREYLKPKEPPAITRADRIRAMTDEELAKELKGIGCPGICRTRYREDDIEQCYKCWLDWLREEVKTYA